jgi:glutamate N-acetyltransferase / amino-acid N-acetyltransferase
MTTWTLPRGYRFVGVHSGIRPDPERLDLALVVSDRPASAAGVFTQNRVAAAPVKLCRERVPTAEARAIVICSGNANACTGQRGLDDARRMATVAAESLACRAEQVLVCSTGVIGRPLPMPELEAGIRAATPKLGADSKSFERAARAILTTDTRIKVSTRTVNLNGPDVQVTGFAKGAAMIGPNMATMLAFVLSDAAVSPRDLQALAGRVAEHTFNCISVEGHTSTNDTLLLLANGEGPHVQGAALAPFSQAVAEVCGDLSREIAGDAEGASHLITIDVEGLRNDSDAKRIAKAVADSALVKTALFGADPNWGRIVSAAGYAGVPFDEPQLSLWLGQFLLYQHGTPLPFDAAAVSAYIKNNRALDIRLLFNLGSGRCTFYTCDLTYDYVRINAEYTT